MGVGDSRVSRVPSEDTDPMVRAEDGAFLRFVGDGVLAPVSPSGSSSMLASDPCFEPLLGMELTEDPIEFRAGRMDNFRL